MLDVVRYLLFALFILSTICAGFTSIRGRRASDFLKRGLYQAMTNIWMGIMLIVLALIQMFMFSGSTVAVIVEGMFLVLGAFNLFAGIRNRIHYSQMKNEKSPI
ncbi:YtpI family protein [Paenibacillus sp. 453mf]|uniref:YtpI family protein n=1 Tax=Paenibacillus sp. 453mf TaxID=1761874 RepID=UPI0008EFAB61|nr:YtpI family protein [Paenibacillus sp. 453mf]SFS44430.1 YtpI-like protein [Paenibacillus sp. 453mf]